MASCLKSRKKFLLSQKPIILSLRFSADKWFGTLAYQDHMVHKTSTIIADRLRASFSTQAVANHKTAVTKARSNIPGDKHKPLQEKFLLKNCRDLFKAWGCSNEETSQLFERMSSLYMERLDDIQSRLKVLEDLGFTSVDLVKMVRCRARFLTCRINHCLNKRVRYLKKLFGSRERLQQAILKNPSVLTFDLKAVIEPTVELYKAMGITGNDLARILLSRPNIISRTSLNTEKLEYIRRTGISKDSKMYKYLVNLMAISRLETIRQKIANLEKFGLLEDEVLFLLGSSPLVLSLSVDKVHRNMTFVVACMKQPARVVLGQPFLLCSNLEKVMKPRMTVAWKIDDMGLVPRVDGPRVFTALRMKEKRFLEVFITCHPPEIAKELMECFLGAKNVTMIGRRIKKTNLLRGLPI